MNEITEIKDVKQWEAIKSNLEASEELVIFKYSPICSISASVEMDFNSWQSGLAEDVKLKFARVNVIKARDASRRIAEDINVLHQSPQVIWLKGNAEVKWSASHFDITKESLGAQL